MNDLIPTLQCVHQHVVEKAFGHIEYLKHGSQQQRFGQTSVEGRLTVWVGGGKEGWYEVERQKLKTHK